MRLMQSAIYNAKADYLSKVCSSAVVHTEDFTISELCGCTELLSLLALLPLQLSDCPHKLRYYYVRQATAAYPFNRILIINGHLQVELNMSINFIDYLSCSELLTEYFIIICYSICFSLHSLCSSSAR